jgi:hypothetical protein
VTHDHDALFAEAREHPIDQLVEIGQQALDGHRLRRDRLRERSDPAPRWSQ